MVRTTLPEGDSVSPVRIRSLHWHKYIGDIVKDYILTGLGLSAGTGLNVNVAAGRGYVRGIDFESDAQEAVPVVASSTNYIFAQLTFDGELGITGWQFVVNQTGTPPSDSILLGTATTDGSGVTGTSVTATQQGLALKDLAVSQIKAPVGGTLTVIVDNLQMTNIKAKDGTLAIAITDVTGAMDLQGRPLSNVRILSSELEIRNPANTFSYIFVGSAIAANRNVTIPLLTANDTLVFANFTQTLADKTLTTPTIASFTNATHNHQSAAGGGTLDAAAIAAGTMATARLGSGTADATTFLRGDSTWEQIKDKWVIKSADETITNDSTLSDDGELVIALEANKTYIGQAVIYFSSDATPDFKYAFAIPASATGNRNSTTITGAGNTTDTLTTVRVIGVGNTAVIVVVIVFRIIVAGTAGNLAFQWAQEIADAANTSVKKGSSLMVREV